MAQREAASALRLANDALRRNADTIVTIGAARSAVLPLWIMAALLAMLVGEGAALLFR